MGKYYTKTACFESSEVWLTNFDAEISNFFSKGAIVNTTREPND